MKKYTLWKEEQMSYFGAHNLLVALFNGYSMTYSAPVSNPLGFILKVFLHWLSVKHNHKDDKTRKWWSKTIEKISKRFGSDVAIGYSRWLDPDANCEPIGLCVIYPDGRRTIYMNIIRKES